jgi:N-acetylglucosaminyldiphosphoundecaprenol N-acetyl-beta-D-mannosaminyltransferase
LIDRGKHNVLGVAVDAIDYEAAVERIAAAARAGQPLSVSALAVHGVMTGVLDAVQRHRLNHLDLVVPDGQPVRWALNALHHSELPDRVYGPTLMLRVCERAARDGQPVFLYGSRPAVVETLAGRLAERFPTLSIAGRQPSRFRSLSAEEKRALTATIRASGARITFVGLGCPRQEVWAYEYRDGLHMPVLAVGAAFDFHAGVLPQAPVAMQRLGLEWLYRFLREPRRLWRRYLLLNPSYLALLALQASGLKRFDLADTTAPEHEIGYG